MRMPPRGPRGLRLGVFQSGDAPTVNVSEIARSSIFRDSRRLISSVSLTLAAGGMEPACKAADMRVVPVKVTPLQFQ